MNNHGLKNKHFAHIKKSASSLEILGLSSSTVLKKELALREKEISKLREMLEKYERENNFMKEQCQKNKKELFAEIWSVKMVIRFFQLIHFRGFIGMIFFLNVVLLIAMFFFSFKNNFLAKNQNTTKQALKHSLFLPYTIEIVSFDSIHWAEKSVLRLKSLGFQSYIGKVFKKSKAVYRVYVNEYANLDSAQKDLKVLKKKYNYNKSFIRRKF